MLPRALASVIVVVVTLVWTASFVAQFIIPEYKPDPAINGIFLAITGGALALSRKDSNGKGSDDEPPRSRHARRDEP